MRSSGFSGSSFTNRNGFHGVGNRSITRHNGNWQHGWDRGHHHYFDGRFWRFSNGFWYGYPDDFYAYGYPYDYDDEPVYMAPADPGDATVTAAQTELARLGYYHGSIDGIFGPQSRAAIAAYQTARHLRLTRTLTTETLQSLGVTLAAG
jgi:hypothetical protein